MEKKNIHHIEEWTDDPDSLPDSLRVKVGVRPTILPQQQVIAFPDLKDRVKFAREYRRKQFKALLQQLGVTTYELVGSEMLSRKPRYGVFTYETTLGELCARLDESIREQVWIKEMEGHTPKPKPAQTSYYCLKLLFQIQYEGLQGGLQEYDLQVVMIQADSSEQALEKLQNYYIPAWETPYLNSDLRLVRWKFVEVVDDYQFTPYKPWDEQMQEGLEVFSTFYKKRWNPADYWDGWVEPTP